MRTRTIPIIVLINCALCGIWICPAFAESHPDISEKAVLSTRLTKAAELGDMNKVKDLLAQGADPNFLPKRHIRLAYDDYWKNPWSALASAAYAGHYTIISLLLSHNTQINQLGPDEETALSWVLGSQKMTNSLLDHGAKVDARDSKGATPLMWAAETNSVKTMQILIAHGANVNAVDKCGKTPLMHAANFLNTRWRESDPDSAEILLRYRVNVNARDKQGNTALMWLAQTDDTRGQQPDAVRFAQLLLEHAARVNLRNRYGKSALDFAKASGLGDLMDLLQQH